MKLSILVPGIRTQNWKALYDSVECKYEWEMIFISPYPLPEELKKDNVVHIEDFGSPMRCQQIGLLKSIGKYISWAADDGSYRWKALENAIGVLDKKQNAVVMGKYMEGAYNPEMIRNHYYVLNNHNATAGLKKQYWMLNCGVVPRQMLIDVGGWDCQFEVCPMAYNDLAIRLQDKGIEFIIQCGLMFECSHTPGHQGDHGPIHDAQIDHDEPLFKKLWKDGKRKSVIPLVNWVDAPERWTRRFGK